MIFEQWFGIDGERSRADFPQNICSSDEFLSGLEGKEYLICASISREAHVTGEEAGDSENRRRQ